jgi:hypothetical protein
MNTVQIHVPSEKVMPAGREWALLAARAKRRYARFLIVLVACCAGLVPWIVYLAFSMPTGYRAEAWSAAWVGFDILLLFALVGTITAALLDRQIVVLLAVASATLLLCDAWFDIVLCWGTRDVFGSIASATLVELPLAAFLLAQAGMLIRISQRVRWCELGLPGDPPALHQMPILLSR